MRTVLAVVLLVAVVTAGCADTYRVSDQPPDGVTTDADSVTTTPETAAGETTARTTIPFVTTDEEPQKGDQFLSVSERNESRAMRFDASKRANFSDLSSERQQVVERAIECDCNVELDGEFSFHDKDRVEVVSYDGTYYFLRVSIA